MGAYYMLGSPSRMYISTAVSALNHPACLPAAALRSYWGKSVYEQYGPTDEATIGGKNLFGVCFTTGGEWWLGDAESSCY